MAGAVRGSAGTGSSAVMVTKRRHRRSIKESGHAHELTFSCFRRDPFLSKDRAREWLAASIRTACVNLDFSLWAFDFMPDHVHLSFR